MSRVDYISGSLTMSTPIQKATLMAPTFIDHLDQIRTEDARNIQEKYRWWDHENIVEDLAENRSQLITIFQNVGGDFNISSGIRNNLWFNTSGTYIFGNRKYDKRGTVGAHHYTPVNFTPNLADLLEALKADAYRIVAAEITDDALPITTYQWNLKTVVIFGEESNGLDKDTLDLADDIVFIPGRGSIRSLNVATTSGIFLYDYSAKTGLLA